MNVVVNYTVHLTTMFASCSNHYKDNSNDLLYREKTIKQGTVFEAPKGAAVSLEDGQNYRLSTACRDEPLLRKVMGVVKKKTQTKQTQSARENV